jgi:hypothetical protein
MWLFPGFIAANASSTSSLDRLHRIQTEGQRRPAKASVSRKGLTMKPFTTLTVLFLALIAILQVVRFVFAWPIMIEGTAVPVWASAIAAIVAGGLATMLWKESFGWHLPPAFGRIERRI